MILSGRESAAEWGESQLQEDGRQDSSRNPRTAVQTEARVFRVPLLGGLPESQPPIWGLSRCARFCHEKQLGPALERTDPGCCLETRTNYRL